MKVKELIEELQKLDQERNIWLIYNLYAAYEPCVRIANEFEVGEYEYPHNKVVKEGDYVL